MGSYVECLQEMIMDAIEQPLNTRMQGNARVYEMNKQGQNSAPYKTYARLCRR